LTNHDQTRVASELQGHPGRLRTAAAMLLLGPGVPFVYYAEELGQPGTKPDPMLRTPMPWVEPGEPGGFSKAKPWAEPFAAPAGTSVARQTGEEASLLSWYRRLIALRRVHEALATGGVVQVRASAPGVYAFLRTAPQNAGAKPVLVLINLGDHAVSDVRLSAERWPLERAMQGRDVLREKGELVRLSGKDGALIDAPGPSLEAFGVLVVPLESVW
jgi:glycosidase